MIKDIVGHLDFCRTLEQVPAGVKPCGLVELIILVASDVCHLNCCTDPSWCSTSLIGFVPIFLWQCTTVALKDSILCDPEPQVGCWTVDAWRAPRSERLLVSSGVDQR